MLRHYCLGPASSKVWSRCVASNPSSPLSFHQSSPSPLQLRESFHHLQPLPTPFSFNHPRSHFSSTSPTWNTNNENTNKQQQQEEASQESEGFQWGVGSVLAVTAAIALTRHFRSNFHHPNTAGATPDTPSVSCELYKMLPLRFLSRMYGKMNSVVLPEWARAKVYNTYGSIFGCLMDEVEKPLEEYANLGEFFTRRLKSGSRPIADAQMVSPVDGRVLTFGKVTSDTVEQVKGVRYSMSYFLGEPVAPLLKQGRHLYQIVLYLAPGDYHGFHSPVDWTMDKRVHFHGYMLSVSKVVAKFVPGLFAINERVVLRGKWDGGVLYYSPVAATNVGNIAIREDPEVVTDVAWKSAAAQEETWKEYKEGIEVKKGDEIGFFKLGSTIVMVFESDKDFEFLCKEGEKVRLGEPLGRIGAEKTPNA